MLGAIAIVLAVIGLYSVVTFSIQRRTREIGIRIALGAKPQSILSQVLRGGIQLTCFGIGLGVIVAQATTRLIENHI
jgi:putative ABC transport system permease protein